MNPEQLKAYDTLIEFIRKPSPVNIVVTPTIRDAACLLSTRDVVETPADRTTSILIAALRNSIQYPARLDWVMSRFWIQVDDLRHKDCEFLRVAYYVGGLARLARLHKEHSLTREDVSANEHELLRAAANSGDWVTVQWLAETFNLTSVDARAKDNAALRGAAGGSYLQVIKYLVESMGLKKSDALDRASGDSAFLAACNFDHREVINWLIEKFSMTAEDIRAHDNAALVECASSAHFDTLKLLTEKFGLTLDDLQSPDRVIMKLMIEHESVDGIRWLLSRGWILSDAEIEHSRGEGITL
jgi:hypothetical protein